MQKRSSGLDSVPHELYLADPRSVYAFSYQQADREIRALHFHPYPELGYCHRGAGVFVIGNDVVSYGPGDFVVIPALAPHLAQSMIGSTSDWTFSYFEPRSFLGPRRNLHVLENAAHVNPHADPLLCDTARLFSRAALDRGQAHPEDSDAFNPPRVNEVLQGYAQALLALLADRPTATRHAAPPAGELAAIAPALHHLGVRFHEPLSIDVLAARCNLSPAHFRRLFKRATGLTPRAYLFKVRIEMAKGMLAAQDDTVLDISLAVGFDSLSSFHRQFRALARTTPLQWRQAQRPRP